MAGADVDLATAQRNSIRVEEAALSEGIKIGHTTDAKNYARQRLD